ncbi:hypothetical protein ACIBVL_40335 [Streptomyces sp. NPDC049687]|uniref:hypothetical protein n=1 Tax=Streptomyces sp. NPDC049687 TaxID=3365596 RepID=UPI003797992C
MIKVRRAEVIHVEGWAEIRHLHQAEQMPIRAIARHLGISTRQAADRWTWLITTAHTPLRLASPTAEDPSPAPKRPTEPDRPGPGRPLRAKNRHPATRHDAERPANEAETFTERARAGGQRKTQ